MQVKGDLDALRFDMASVKAEASGITVFITSMQKHIDKLNSNMTTAFTNLTMVADDIMDIMEHMEEVDDDMNTVKINLTSAMVLLELNEMQDKVRLDHREKKV